MGPTQVSWSFGKVTQALERSRGRHLELNCITDISPALWSPSQEQNIRLPTRASRTFLKAKVLQTKYQTNKHWSPLMAHHLSAKFKQSDLWLCTNVLITKANEICGYFWGLNDWPDCLVHLANKFFSTRYCSHRYNFSSTVERIRLKYDTGAALTLGWLICLSCYHATMLKSIKICLSTLVYIYWYLLCARKTSLISHTKPFLKWYEFLRPALSITKQ